MWRPSQSSPMASPPSSTPSPHPLLSHQLLESEHSKRPSNVHVVYYDQVAHATPRDPRWRHEKPAYVHPLYHVKNRLYADMREFADVVVRQDRSPHVACGRQ